MNSTSTMPLVLEANTFFWTPGRQAEARRSNEARHHRTVAKWLEAYGFELSHDNGDVKTYRREQDGIIVRFLYRESCSYVYKKLHVFDANDKPHNRRWLANRLDVS